MVDEVLVENSQDAPPFAFGGASPTPKGERLVVQDANYFSFGGSPSDGGRFSVSFLWQLVNFLEGWKRKVFDLYRESDNARLPILPETAQ